MSAESKRHWRHQSARNYVADLLASASWKDRQRRPCSECGTLMSYDNTGKLCTRCGNKARRYWTQDRVLAAFYLFIERNGRRPTATDWNNSEARALGYPSLTATYGRHGAFATWSDLTRAAGFTPPRDGHYIDESKRREAGLKAATTRSRKASAGRSSGEAMQANRERGD